MVDAVIFSPSSSLDFQDVRSNVIRIPEVSARLSEVEDMWGRLELANMNVHNYFISDDNVFLQNIKLKKIASTIVQLGLYDRYIKKFGHPQFVVGHHGDLSALKIVVGKQTLNNMLFETYMQKDEDVVSVKEDVAPVIDLPQLSGVKLLDCAVFEVQKEAKAFVSVPLDVADYSKVMMHMIEEYSVKKWISIGPGNNFHQQIPQLSMCDVQLLDSIDLDPMLNWFWPGLQASEWMEQTVSQ